MISYLKEGLLAHEFVLLIAGFILFMALLGLLLLREMRNKPWLSVLYTLVFPILMIAWPSIKRIQWSKDLLNIETINKKESENQSLNHLDFNKLVQALKDIEKKSIKEEHILDISKALFKVGEPLKAKNLLTKIKDLDEYKHEIKILKKRINDVAINKKPMPYVEQ